MENQIANIPIEKLLEPRTILRLVDKNSIEYMELLDTLRVDGFLLSISVRPAKDQPGYYEIIDGLSRYTASKELGIKSLPCIIKHGLSDEDCLALQLKANAIRLETTPAEYAERLKRILTLNPHMTLADLSGVVGKSPSWVGTHLKLLSLNKEIRKAVDRGEIPLKNAYKLALIPGRMQSDYVDRAKVMPVKEFTALASSVVKQYKEAIRQGKLEAFWTAEFKPTAHLRKLMDVQHEYDHRSVGPLLLAAENCQSPLDGFYLALAWAMHLDRRSVREQEAHARQRSQKQRLVPDVELDD
jgi:ParB/RepB/Spo0J family partition protein